MNIEELKGKVCSQGDTELSSMLLAGPDVWSREALEIAKTELETRLGRKLRFTEFLAFDKSETNERVEMVLRGQTEANDPEFRTLEEFVKREIAETFSEEAIVRHLQSRGLSAEVAGMLIHFVKTSNEHTAQIAAVFLRRAVVGPFLAVIGAALSLATGGRYIFVGLLAVGVVWFFVGIYGFLKWSNSQKVVTQLGAPNQITRSE